MKDMIDATSTPTRPWPPPSTWVLSNHDVARHVSRYARPPQEEGSSASSTISWTVLRTCRRHPACPVLRSCRCSHCPAARTPTRARSSGCRKLKTRRRCSAGPDVPAIRDDQPGPRRLPGTPAGPDTARPSVSPRVLRTWLPQPDDWGSSVARQTDDASSMLSCTGRPCGCAPVAARPRRRLSAVAVHARGGVGFCPRARLPVCGELQRGPGGAA